MCREAEDKGEKGLVFPLVPRQKGKETCYFGELFKMQGVAKLRKHIFRAFLCRRPKNWSIRPLRPVFEGLRAVYQMPWGRGIIAPRASSFGVLVIKPLMVPLEVTVACTEGQEQS